ncbi:hypothetical protein R3P38DRAFT_2521771 [Favolaschia claudopus]|uniref:Transmembrane protein n=1 Tax=Favolaschia claudopus TaxID=2862362 RepID=A0AAW0C138_9AGAR
MAALNLTTLPNPLTPYALLPPEIAHQTQIGSYILIGTLGAYIWDILSNINNDYKLLFEYRVGVSTLVYFFSSRLWSLLFILSSAMFETYPLVHCSLAQTLVEVCFAIAVPSTSLLFVLRARAIFDRNPSLIFLFFLVWLSVVASAATTPTAITATNIGHTPFCINIGVKAYAGAAGITPLVNDTFIFLAISWRLFRNSYADTRTSLRGSVRAFITGEYLPQFSRALLKDGQLYYLITVTANTLTVVMFYNTRVAPTYRVMFTVCNIMVTNAMACNVFRNTKFGFHRRIATTSQIMSGVSASTSIPLTVPSPRSRESNRTRTATSANAIHVNKIVEQVLSYEPVPEQGKLGRAL